MLPSWATDNPLVRECGLTIEELMENGMPRQFQDIVLTPRRRLYTIHPDVLVSTLEYLQVDRVPRHLVKYVKKATPSTYGLGPEIHMYKLLDTLSLKELRWGVFCYYESIGKEPPLELWDARQSTKAYFRKLLPTILHALPFLKKVRPVPFLPFLIVHGRL